jgi:hypothetical protein
MNFTQNGEIAYVYQDNQDDFNQENNHQPSTTVAEPFS